MAREKKFSTPEMFRETRLLLLKYGYEGFTFSLLADALSVSRAAIYKYYMNKEELIIDYMVDEMNKLVLDFENMDKSLPFLEQLDQLLNIIFDNKDIHQILGMAHQIQANGSKSIVEKKEQLEKLHLEMYQILQGFILQGKRENLLKEHLPDDLILGFIFQSINIPNHNGMANDMWINSIKEMVWYGIFHVK